MPREPQRARANCSRRRRRVHGQCRRGRIVADAPRRPCPGVQRARLHKPAYAHGMKPEGTIACPSRQDCGVVHLPLLTTQRRLPSSSANLGGASARCARHPKRPRLRTGDRPHLRNQEHRDEHYVLLRGQPPPRHRFRRTGSFSTGSPEICSRRFARLKRESMPCNDRFDSRLRTQRHVIHRAPHQARRYTRC